MLLKKVFSFFFFHSNLKSYYLFFLHQLLRYLIQSLPWWCTWKLDSFRLRRLISKHNQEFWKFILVNFLKVQFWIWPNLQFEEKAGWEGRQLSGTHLRRKRVIRLSFCVPKYGIILHRTLNLIDDSQPFRFMCSCGR